MIKRVIIRDVDKRIVSILYIEEDSKLSYRQCFTFDGTKLMQVELLLDGYFVGTIQCWRGTVEEKEMIRNEYGILVEKEV